MSSGWSLNTGATSVTGESASPGPCGSSILRGAWGADVIHLPKSMEKTIRIKKGNLKIGLKLDAVDKGINGCMVKDIHRAGAFGKDGRVKVGDLFLKVNNENLRNATNSQARSILRRTNLICTDFNVTYVSGSEALGYREQYLKQLHAAQTPAGPSGAMGLGGIPVIDTGVNRAYSGNRMSPRSPTQVSSSREMSYCDDSVSTSAQIPTPSEFCLSGGSVTTSPGPGHLPHDSPNKSLPTSPQAATHEHLLGDDPLGTSIPPPQSTPDQKPFRPDPDLLPPSEPPPPVPDSPPAPIIDPYRPNRDGIDLKVRQNKSVVRGQTIPDIDETSSSNEIVGVSPPLAMETGPSTLVSQSPEESDTSATQPLVLDLISSESSQKEKPMYGEPLVERSTVEEASSADQVTLIQNVADSQWLSSTTKTEVTDIETPSTSQISQARGTKPSQPPATAITQSRRPSVPDEAFPAELLTLRATLNGSSLTSAMPPKLLRPEPEPSTSGTSFPDPVCSLGMVSSSLVDPMLLDAVPEESTGNQSNEEADLMRDGDSDEDDINMDLPIPPTKAPAFYSEKGPAAGIAEEITLPTIAEQAEDVSSVSTSRDDVCSTTHGSRKSSRNTFTQPESQQHESVKESDLKLSSPETYQICEVDIPESEPESPYGSPTDPIAPSPTSPLLSNCAKYWGEPRTVVLDREPGLSLGISIVGGKVEMSSKSQPSDNSNEVSPTTTRRSTTTVVRTRSSKVAGIFIKNVIPNSPAGRSGQLFMGDRIVSVNDTDLKQATHEYAVDVIRSAPNPIKFLVQSLHYTPATTTTTTTTTSPTTTNSDTTAFSNINSAAITTATCSTMSATNVTRSPTTSTTTTDATTVLKPLDTVDTAETEPTDSLEPKEDTHKQPKDSSQDFTCIEPAQPAPETPSQESSSSCATAPTSPTEFATPPHTLSSRSGSLRANVDSNSAAAMSKANEDESDEDEYGYTSQKVQLRYSDICGSDDCKIHVVTIKRPLPQPTAAEPSPKPQGLGLSLAGNRDLSQLSVFVVGIAEHSPADRCGFIRVGDELLEINGMVLHGRSHLNATAIIKSIRSSVFRIVLLSANYEDYGFF